MGGSQHPQPPSCKGRSVRDHVLSKAQDCPFKMIRTLPLISRKGPVITIDFVEILGMTHMARGGGAGGEGVGCLVCIRKSICDSPLMLIISILLLLIYTVITFCKSVICICNGHVLYFSQLANYLCQVWLCKLLISLSGDTELNPGPKSNSYENFFSISLERKQYFSP